MARQSRPNKSPGNQTVALGLTTATLGYKITVTRTLFISRKWPSGTGEKNHERFVRLCDKRAGEHRRHRCHPLNCQYRLKIPHSSGRKFPTPEPQKGASLASDGAEPSAVFWRVLGEAESEAKEVGAAAPSCPRGGTRPARRRSFSR